MRLSAAPCAGCCSGGAAARRKRSTAMHTSGGCRVPTNGCIPPVCSHRIARLFLARQPPQPSQQPQPEIVPALTALHCCAAPAGMRCRLLGDLKRSGLSVGSVDHTPYAAVCLVGGCYEALGWAVDCKRFHTITKSVANGCEALVRVDWNDVNNHSWCTVWPVRFFG